MRALLHALVLSLVVGMTGCFDFPDLVLGGLDSTLEGGIDLNDGAGVEGAKRDADARAADTRVDLIAQDTARPDLPQRDTAPPPPRPNGATCSQANQCVSGYCQDREGGGPKICCFASCSVCKVDGKECD